MQENVTINHSEAAELNTNVWPTGGWGCEVFVLTNSFCQENSILV